MDKDILKKIHSTLKETDDLVLIYELTKEKELDNNTKNYIDSLLFFLKRDFAVSKKYFDKIELLEEEESDEYQKSLYYLLMFKIDAIFLEKSELFSKINYYLEKHKETPLIEFYNYIKQEKDILKIFDYLYSFKSFELEDLERLKYYAEIKNFRENKLEVKNDTYYILTVNKRCLKYLRLEDEEDEEFKFDTISSLEDKTQKTYSINPYKIKFEHIEDENKIQINNISLDIQDIVHSRVNKSFTSIKEKNPHLITMFLVMFSIMFIIWVTLLVFVYKNTPVTIIISVVYIVVNLVLITYITTIFAKKTQTSKLSMLEIEILQKNMKKIKIDMLEDLQAFEDDIKCQDLIERSKEIVEKINNLVKNNK